MRYVLPMVVIAALVLAVPVLAQGTDVDKKLAEIDKKLEELTKLKADLEAMRDGMQAAGAAEKKASWADKVKISGYFHARGQYRDWTEDDFDLRRMYINLVVTPNDKTLAWVQWARIGTDPLGQTGTDWSMAFVDYKWDSHWSTRFGQGPNWFGIETMQGSSSRLALERAAVLEGTSRNGAPNGLYFLGPWDRGLWITRNPDEGDKWVPQATLGIINGQFRNTEKDDNKTISVDLKWKQKWGQFCVSWMDGKYVWDVPRLLYADIPPPAALPVYGTSLDREAILGGVRWDPPGSRWAVQGEYVDGEHLGNDIEGWYTQVEYDPCAKGTAYVKVEQYDPAVGVAGNNSYHAWHVGYAHWLDANNELTLQFSNGENNGDATHPDRTQVGLQWQLGF